MRRTRVLHVVGSLDLGGAQKLTALIAVGLDSHAFEVAVLNLGPPGVYGERLRTRGIQVFDLGLPLRPFARLPQTLRALWRLWRVLFSRPRWDIVHTHLFRTSLLCALPARLSGSRLFGTVHRVYYKWQPPVERLLAPLHEAIVVDSFAVGHILQSQTHIPVNSYVVIHNGIDTAEFDDQPSRARSRKTLQLPSQAVVITEIAHLEDHKGQQHLLSAFARIADPRAILLLVGDGSKRSELQQHAVRLGLGSRVVFTGARADLPILLAASDVLVLPSTFEGFGIVQAEAMYLGLPVVAGDRGGSTEVVVDGVTGYLVPFGDVERLTYLLARLVESPNLRRTLGQAGRARVLERFTLGTMAAKYADLYRGTIARGLEAD